MPILFLKASGTGRKIAHQAGYVLINGHWQKAHKDLKAPKNAPKAAHPEAAGKHKPYQMPEEQASKLKYAPEKAAGNVEMKNFNEKHVPSLLSHAAKGDATAILGTKFGTNTHSKKLVAIANHLLEMMGSQHKVMAGQLAGAHAAVMTSPEPAVSEQAPATPEQAQAFADEVKDAAVDELAKPAPHVPETAEQSSVPSLAMPAFMSGKTSKGVRTAYEVQAQKIIDAGLAGDVGTLQGMVNPNAGSWKGKTANSKLLLNLYAQALSHAQQQGQKVPRMHDEPTPVAAVETIATSPAKPKPRVKVSDFAAAVANIDWAPFTIADTIKGAAGYNKLLDAVKKAAAAGDMYGILAMKYGVNTHAKKIAKAANTALAALGYPQYKVVLGKDAVHPALGELTAMEQAAQDDAAIAQDKQAVIDQGPKEGDTRQGKSGMLVFHDGHWHKQETGEPVAVEDAAPVFKNGSPVTIADMSNLPAGTIIQTYNKEGKPSQKFMLGHTCAWFINAKGKQLKNPIAVGNYASLVGIDADAWQEKQGYYGGYHNAEHPTTIEKLGRENYVTAAQKHTIKHMFDGAVAANPSTGVYPMMNGQIMVVGSPELASQAWWVDEKGGYGHISNVVNGHTDPHYTAFVEGKDPGNNIAGQLGLVVNNAELDKPPFHPNAHIAGALADLHAQYEKGELNEALTGITELVAKLSQIPADENGLATLDWLIALKNNLLSKGAANVTAPELAPAPEVEPAKLTPLPQWKSVEEFDAWHERHANKWIDEAELYFGTEAALEASPEGQHFDAWLEKSNAAKQRKIKAEEEAKAKAAALAKEKAELRPSSHQKLWEPLFETLDAMDKDENPWDTVHDWLKEHGDSARNVSIAVEALQDAGFKFYAGEYAKMAATKWMQEAMKKYPGVPVPNYPSPLTVIGYDSLQKGMLKMMAEQLKGKEADPEQIDHLAEMYGQGTKAMEEYKTIAHAYLKHLGPQEGDTKAGKTGTLIFHNGHWILMSEYEAVQGQPVDPSMDAKMAFVDEIEAAGSASKAMELAEKFLKQYGNHQDAYNLVAGALAEYGYGKKISELPTPVIPGGKPGKPWKPVVDSVTWQTAIDAVTHQVNHAETEDLNTLGTYIAQTAGLNSADAQATHKYALEAYNWIAGQHGKPLWGHDEDESQQPTGKAPAPNAAPLNSDTLDTWGVEFAKILSSVDALKYAKQLLDEQGNSPEAYDYVVEAMKNGGFGTTAGKISQEKMTLWGSLAKPVATPAPFTPDTGGDYIQFHEKLQGATEKQAKALWMDYTQNGTADDQIKADACGLLDMQGFGDLASHLAKQVFVKDGPQEGQMKVSEAGTLLVFKNGHWVKAGPDDIVQPDMSAEKFKNAVWGIKNAFDKFGKKALKSDAMTVTNHANGTMSIKVTAPNGSAINGKKLSPQSTNPEVAKLMHYLAQMKMAYGLKQANYSLPGEPVPVKPATSPEATGDAAEAKPVPKKPDDTGKIDYSKLPAVDSWKVVGGQKGSNEGESLQDDQGQKWYVKYPKDEQHAQAEVLAATLYTALGLQAQDAQLVMKNGKLGIASRWMDGLKQGNPKELAAAPGALDGFLADVWLGNRDVVGLSYDNLQIDANGVAVRVDAGASFFFRAQGGKKEFGEDPTELTSMLDAKINHQTASVFGGMQEADFMAAAAKLQQLPDAKIRIMVNAAGPGTKSDRKRLADVLIARKNAILAKYPVNSKGEPIKALDPTALNVDPDRLPKRHDFENWNGEGKGLSSKAHLNKANSDVEKLMAEVAATGDLIALKNFKYQPIDPNTGEPAGALKPISEYPSKHVVYYHQDLVNVLDEIANPPVALKIFHEIDVDSVEELDAAFPTKPFGTTVASVEAQEKMGFWVGLGRVAKADVAKLMPKKTMAYPAAAISAAYDKYKKAGKLAKAFINGIQASGSYNDLFRDGKEKDHHGNNLKEVAKAALDFATEQPAGTKLYRWQNMSADMVKKFLKAEDGTVFTTVGSMCTSYSENATSHFGKHKVTIVYAEGAKAVESFGSGSFSGEKEVTTLPGGRFMISKKEMVGDRLELELLMLPPDLGL